MSPTERPTKPESPAQDEIDGPAPAGLLSSEPAIAALASGHNRGAIAVIRVSGPGCHQRLALCLLRMRWHLPRQMQLVAFVDPSNIAEPVDEPLVACFIGPHSFTGEDSVEIFCHGGSYIVRRVLQVIYAQGIRPAEPGEFTRRAFLNGKLNLTEAEGIRQLVEAHSEHQWRAARFLAEGRFGAHIEGLRQALLGAMAYLEAGIDFPDEGDTKEVNLVGVSQRVRDVDDRLKQLELSYQSGRIARTGLKLAIVGAPNMGKSTLMNELLGRDRAIVTEVAGTTRDYLEESCLILGRSICLVDTAGLRETDDKVEQLGVARSMELSQEADCVLLLVSSDASQCEREQLEVWRRQIGEAKCLTVVTKADLACPSWTAGHLLISCRTQQGLDELRKVLAGRVDESIGALGDEPYLTSERHLHAVSVAREYLRAYFDGGEAGLYEEMLAFELQNAAKSLSELIGRVENDDILGEIFSQFCVGK